MPAHSLAPNLQRFFFLLCGCILVIACLYVAKAILLPIVVASLFTFILSPVVAALEKLRLGRILSVLLATGFALTFLTVLGWLFVHQLGELAQEFPKHQDTIVRKIAGLQGTEEGLLGKLYSSVQEIGDRIRKESKHPEQVMTVFVTEPRFMDFNWVRVLVGPLIESLIGAVFVVVLAVLMLINRENLRDRVIRLAGNARLISTTKVLDDVAHRVSRFLFAVTFINFTFGVILGVGLLIIGVPYPLFFAFLAGLLRFVPYVGSAIAVGLLMICNFALFPGWSECLLTLGLFVTLELLTAYVVEPLFFGRRTGASPMALLLAAAFWTWLWGPIGLMLSTPLTASLIVLGTHVPNLAFLHILLGDEPLLAPALHYYQRLLARDQDEAMEVVTSYLHDHRVESVYDHLLVPALILAKHDVALDALAESQQDWIHQVVRETLDEIIGEVIPAANAPEPAGGVRRCVFACAAQDEADDLAVHMFEQVLTARGAELRTYSSQALAAEILSAVEEQEPHAVVIVTLPAGGLAHTQYLCKRLRAQFPQLTIIVGRWGISERVEEVRERARAGGATDIGTNLLSTADAVVPAPATPLGERAKVAAVS